MLLLLYHVALLLPISSIMSPIKIIMFSEFCLHILHSISVSFCIVRSRFSYKASSIYRAEECIWYLRVIDGLQQYTIPSCLAWFVLICRHVLHSISVSFCIVRSRFSYKASSIYRAEECIWYLRVIDGLQQYTIPSCLAWFVLICRHVLHSISVSFCIVRSRLSYKASSIYRAEECIWYLGAIDGLQQYTVPSCFAWFVWPKYYLFPCST